MESVEGSNGSIFCPFAQSCDAALAAIPVIKLVLAALPIVATCAEARGLTLLRSRWSAICSRNEDFAASGFGIGGSLIGGGIGL